MLYRNYKGPLSSEDRAALGINSSGLNNADLQALTNMDLLAANKDALVDLHNAVNRKRKKNVVEDDVPYHTSRYEPLLKKILEVRRRPCRPRRPSATGCAGRRC